MSNSGFTEEQQKQLKTLHKKYGFKMLFVALKCCLMLFLVDFLVIAIDTFYLHSKFFIFLSSFTGGFLFFKIFLDNLRFLADNLKIETLKILEDKQ